MAQRMTTAAFANAHPSDGVLHGPLQHRLRDMVATLNIRAWINGSFRGGKDVLPEPKSARVRVLALKGVRQIHVAVTLSQICFMQELNFGEMVLQRLLKGLWQYRHAVLSPLAIPHGNLLVGEMISLTRKRTHSMSRRPAP